MTTPPRAARASRGFTLFEIAIVVVVLGFLLVIIVGMTASLIGQQRREVTRSRMANVDLALTLYVSQNKRLPCPADGTLATGAENASGSPRTCTNDQQNGVVPWTALGIAAVDIEDGWGNRLTYRVGPDLVIDGAMDFTNCDPAGTSPTGQTVPPYCIAAGSGATQCNAGNLGSCTSPNKALAGAPGKGLVVKDAAGTIVMDPRGTVTQVTSTGAAYVVISNGEAGGGGYGKDGTLQSSAVPAGTEETMNFANKTYTAPPVLPGAPTKYLVDDVYNGVGTTHFDDMVSRPNILSVATKAQLGPRSR